MRKNFTVKENIHFPTVWVSILLVVIINIGVIILPNLSITQVEAVLQGTYNRDPAVPASMVLTMNDWNLLDEDFLATDGSNGMLATLDMNDNYITNMIVPGLASADYAVSKQYVDTAAGSGAAKTPGGAALDIICSSYVPLVCGNRDCWRQYGPNGVYVRVPSNTGFSNPPWYLTSLSGTHSEHVISTASIYYSGARTSGPNSEFEIQMTYIGKNGNGIIDDPTSPWDNMRVLPMIAQSWGWKINWCAIGS